jgi:hypothetical protein
MTLPSVSVKFVNARLNPSIALIAPSGIQLNWK